MKVTQQVMYGCEPDFTDRPAIASS